MSSFSFKSVALKLEHAKYIEAENKEFVVLLPHEYQRGNEIEKYFENTLI